MRKPQAPASTRIIVSGKENRASRQPVPAARNGSPLARQAMLNRVNTPIARYLPSTDIDQFVQALRDHPGAELVERRGGGFALIRPEQVPSRKRISPVKLLMELMAMMRKQQWPFSGKNPAQWDRYFALVYLVEFERACSREPAQAMLMLAEAIEHVMDIPKEQLKCVERKFRPLN